VGGDTDMHALLIQKIEGHSAGVQLWRHADGVWSIERTLLQSGIPLEGEIRVHADSSGVEFFVDGEQRINVPVEQFPWQQGEFGIRWIGATIYPPNVRGSGISVQV
jgi:hypothetical protein